MKRVTEPELMLDAEQAKAYAAADFSDSDKEFVNRFIETFGRQFDGDLIDLGCGPGNISLILAETFPTCRIVGVEGAANMLEIARRRAAEKQLNERRLEFLELIIPSEELDSYRAEAILSNSLLHHLHNPEVLWQTIKQLGKPGAAVFIADLRRPVSEQRAWEIVKTYASEASDILQQDYFYSLCAAFEAKEVEDQLRAADLAGLKVVEVADRYIEISGRLPA